MKTKTQKTKEKRQRIRDFLNFLEDETLLYPTGFEDAIVGIVQFNSYDNSSPKILLDREKCIKILMKDRMSREDAEEFFDFNILGAYMGNKTPAFVSFINDLM